MHAGVLHESLFPLPIKTKQPGFASDIIEKSSENNLGSQSPLLFFSPNKETATLVVDSACLDSLNVTGQVVLYVTSQETP